MSTSDDNRTMFIHSDHIKSFLIYIHNYYQLNSFEDNQNKNDVIETGEEGFQGVNSIQFDEN